MRTASGVSPTPWCLPTPGQRCKRIRTDRHTHVCEASGRNDTQLMGQIGVQFLADGGGGHGGNARCALRDRGCPQTWVFEQGLASESCSRITVKPLEQGFTVGEVLQSAAQLGSHRAPLGPAWGRQLEHAVGPGDSAVDIQGICAGQSSGQVAQHAPI